MCAFAFLPVGDVCTAFEDLQQNADSFDTEELPRLYEYFEDNYIGRFRRCGRRSRPPFPIQCWNVKEHTEEGIPRTNNKLEGWHLAFQSQVDTAHPTLWRFLAALQREEGLQAATLTAFRNGEAVSQPSMVYARVNARLRTLMHGYSEGNTSRDTFIRGVTTTLN